MGALTPCAVQAPQFSSVPVVSRPRANSRRTARSNKLRSVSEKAQERIQSSLAALDALLLPTTPKPAGRFPEVRSELKHCKEVEERAKPSSIADEDVNASSTSESSARTPPAQVARDSEAAERSSGALSTSEPELSLSNWR